MNLTGKWKGKYTLGKGYSPAVIGKTEMFEIEIVDDDGNFTGICIDKITKSIPDNESTLEGIFKENYISFIKKYKYYSFIDSSGEEAVKDDIKVDGIHYAGQLHKRLFSGRACFKGVWIITQEFIKDGESLWINVEGTWSMEKL